uniref:Uncharacterized protein n=1 Tax=Physcomitrium patens TaxID=3218 RepID=A0A2K1JLR8_PHYPA|nr:hypothetical protein PHYPA_017317 [Physcomitrium patens]
MEDSFNLASLLCSNFFKLDMVEIHLESVQTQFGIVNCMHLITLEPELALWLAISRCEEEIVSCG